jgi:hypothetical protein
MPNLSLDDSSWQKIRTGSSEEARQLLDEGVENAEGASLISRQVCEKCQREDALTLYGVHRAGDPAWQHAYVCGDCRWHIEANRIARLSVRAAAQLAQQAANTVMAHLLADRGYSSHWDDEAQIEWWRPAREADNSEYGQRLAEAFEDEFSDQWPARV